MTNIIPKLDSIQIELSELKYKLNSVYDSKNKTLNCTIIAKISEDIDEAILLYTEIIRNLEFSIQSKTNDSNLSSDTDELDIPYLRFYLRDIRGDVEEVCILISLLLYELKNEGSINQQEYKTYTYYKKQIFEMNLKQTFKELICLLEL